MNFDPLIARAIPLWRSRIAQERSLGVLASDIVAIAVDCTAVGGRVHTAVAPLASARMAIDAVEPGLAARILDAPGCPPLPLAVAAIKDAMGRVHAERFSLALEDGCGP